jgi:glycosyltransferase involved in cell wall biosynthesis
VTGRRIGVVVAAYQAERFIDGALASLAAQTRRGDQVIVVDDCSSDRTAQRARSWGDRLPLSVLTLPTNRGAALARRAGIEALDTDLVTVLDADDAVLPDHLAVLEAQLDPGPRAVGASGWFWTPGEALVDLYATTRLTLEPDNQLAQLVIANPLFVATLFRRVDYDAAGGFVDGVHEDWDLWVRMAAVGVQFSISSVPTFLYRRHSDNMTIDPDVVAAMDAKAFEQVCVAAAPHLTPEELARCRHEWMVRTTRDLVRRRWAAGDWAGARRAAAEVGVGGRRDRGLWITAHLPTLAVRVARAISTRMRP